MWTVMVETRQRMDDRLHEAHQWRVAQAARQVRHAEPAQGHRVRVRRAFGRALVRAGCRLLRIPVPRHALHA